MAAGVRRFALVVLLVVALAPGTWLRSSPQPRHEAIIASFKPLAFPPDAFSGPLKLVGAWHVTSRDWRFGGYSSLLPQPDGSLLAVSDGAKWMRFRPSETGGPVAAEFGELTPIYRSNYDSEAVARDPASGTLWVAFEGPNMLTRKDGRTGQARMIMPPQMRHWGVNQGAEAMVRLADGKFVILREGFDGWFSRTAHRGLLFAGDPFANPRAAEFTFVGPEGYKPTDAAVLPDGRMLVLMRQLAWPLPVTTRGLIVLADPAEIKPGAIWRGRVVARMARPLPVDNFEAIAVTPAEGGMSNLWLMSDDNRGATQRTILWRMRLDPARLPPVKALKPENKAADNKTANKKTREPAARPSADAAR